MSNCQQLNSTEKVIWLLKRLGEPPYEMGLTELASEMGHAKSGIYKILSTLIREGLVYQHHSSKKYCLGPTIHRLGLLYDQPKGIISFAEPIVKQIADLTQESIFLGLRQGDDVLVVYGIESPQTLRLRSKLGQSCPIHAGSMGKLMAAYYDQNRIKSILAQMPLVKKTPNTITDPETLFREYERIRCQGYSVSSEENCLGAFGIAAPIRDYHGTVIACISISGPKDRFTPEKVVEWTSLIIDGANEITSRFASKESIISSQIGRNKVSVP